MSRDELTQSLEVRLALLEQENARLRAELDQGKRSYPGSPKSSDLENACAILHAEVAAYRRQQQELQNQVVTAREREQAAQERAGELAKANDALRRSVAHLTTSDSLQSFLVAVLREALQASGAISSAVFSYDEALDVLQMSALILQDEAIEIATDPRAEIWRDPVPASLTNAWQLMSQDRQIVWIDNDNPPPAHWPYGIPWHRQFGHKNIAVVPLFLGEKVLGFLGLCFDTYQQPSEARLEQCWTLAQYAALALQMSYLADHAQQAALAKLNEAVAREQEAAAQERLKELGQINVALAASEQRFRELFEYMVDAAVIHDAEGNILEANYENFNLLGYTREELLQLNCTDVDVWVSNHYEEMKQCWASMQSGDVTTVTSTHRRKDGSLVPVWVRNSTFEWDGKRCFLAAARDMRQLVEVENSLREEVAQRRQAEQVIRRQNFALARSLELLLQQPDTCGFLGALLETLVSELDGVGGTLWLLNEDRTQVNLAIAHLFGQLHPNPTQTLLPHRSYPVQQIAEILLTCQPGWQRTVHYPTSDLPIPTEVRVLHQRDGVKAIFTTPIRLGNQMLGWLTLGSRDTWQDFTRDKVAFLEATAYQSAIALHLNRLAEAAKQTAISREQEKAAQQRAMELTRANTLLRNSLGRLSTDPDLKDVLGHLLVEVTRYAGATVGHIFLYDAAQNTLTMGVRCRNDQAFWLPAEDEPLIFQSPISTDDTPAFSWLCQQPRLCTLNRGEFEGTLWRGVREWFEARGYQASSACVLMVGDRPLGMLSMAFSRPVNWRPVDEELILALAQQIALVIQLTTLVEADRQAMLAREREKLAQERVYELANANQALQRSLNRLTDASDLDSFLGHILVEIAQQVGAEMGHIFLHDVETNTLTMRQGVRDGQAYGTAIVEDSELFHTPFPADLSPAFDYFCQQRGVVFMNCQDLGHLAWTGIQEWLQHQGFHQVAVMALMAGEQPIGLLALAFQEKLTLEPEERGLIHALAHQATLAIQLTRLAEQAKESALFEERNRLAGEIHDTLAQAFTGISIQLKIAKWLVQQDPVAVDQILDRVNDLAQTGLAEARRSIWTLYPAEGAYADLANQLLQCVEQMTRGTSIQVNVRILGTPCPLPPMVGKNLLRIGQEAVTNALRHADASNLQIHLTYGEQSIRLCIQDDGRGFLPDADYGGFGLVGMSDRADRIGGQLIIKSQPEVGTAVCIQVPLR